MSESVLIRHANLPIFSSLTVRTGGGAAVGVVTELMNVHATLGIGIIARDVPCDGGWG